MSTYKVIQDIEAEDKLVGPLTLRQFIYAGVAAVCLYLCFVAFAKHVYFLLVFFLPIAAVSSFFAFPWKGEQPTEIWALARLRFMLKPRVRRWDQSNVKQLVTVLAPRKVEKPRQLTNNLSETEVRSRLKALADTIDSRGWATRNASFGFSPVVPQVQAVAPGQAVLANLNADNDMFDEQGSVAQNFDAMLNKSSQDHRQRVMQQIAQVQTQAPGQMLPSMAPTVAVSPPSYNGYSGSGGYSGYNGQQMAAPSYQPGMPSYSAYTAPALPAPVMSTMAPTPQLPAQQPSFALAPAPAMPPIEPTITFGPPAAGPVSNAPASDYWFANGPTYPDNATGSAVAGLAAPAIPATYRDAVASGRIMTDVPVPAAADPNLDEDAFGKILKQQRETEAAQRINYGHMKVVQPLPDPSAPSITSGMALAPNASAAPSPAMPTIPQPVPGMINYGHPQPVDDQMLYDTSMPQTKPEPPAVTHSTDPAIINAVNQLANNDDLDVATIARQVNRQAKQTPDEVEIRLH